jgi:carbonic anhydrase
LSVIQYAVVELRVKHIIVVGHYRCGGVQAALGSRKSTLVDDWLAPICALRQRHQACLDSCTNEAARWDKLCELNLVEQVRSVCQTSIVREAWARGQELAVHGWIYSVEDGHLRDLDVTASNTIDSDGAFDRALNEILRV